LEIPGQALDRITKTDLHLFLLSLNQFNPTCTRIDVFFDDFDRTINIGELHGIIKNHDYSGFRKGQVKQGFDSGRLIHDEVDFGKRGENGSGKYLRIYDKVLESKGEKNCIRLEIEFTRKRAQIVFERLSCVTSNEALATLCGALVAGSIKFVQRNGDKHISRLVVYDFWRDILDLLGSVVIRVPVRKSDIAGKYNFIFKQVSPTLALLRGTFIDNEDFFYWLDDVIGEGELRMNQVQINLANENKRNIRYDVDRVINRFNRIEQFFEGI
jgi:DNA relaxase NicK